MQIERSQLPHIATKIVQYLKEAPTKGASVLALSGDLGAGKTTLIQDIADSLGVEVRVPSPTFVIMKRYQTRDTRFKAFVHIDAYRIEEAKEVRPLRLDQIFNQDHTLVCIEWPERLFHTLPSGVTKLTLSHVDEHTRLLTTNPALSSYLEK